MFFAGAGYAKLTAPHDHMTLLLGWPAHVTTTTLHGIGMLELVLAATMLAPLWPQGRRVMIIGAAGLIGLQALALIVHASRADLGLAFINVILLGLTTTVLALHRRHE